ETTSPQQPSTHTYRLFNFLKNRCIAAAEKRNYDQLRTTRQPPRAALPNPATPTPNPATQDSRLPLPQHRTGQNHRSAQRGAHYKQQKKVVKGFEENLKGTVLLGFSANPIRPTPANGFPTDSAAHRQPETHQPAATISGEW
ncbi:hypothetical protein, partial [Thauera sp. 2A1]|uniref:hypothetical protein n=1 Tax=Thauera sp. 2A1 TaxID=2570191 RepID=UPI001885844E